jgi:ankyrin repeat protein
VIPRYGPLHQAAQAGNVAILQLLVEEYSSIFNVNQMDDEYNTPLQLAAWHYDRDNSTTMCRLLLAHGANPNEFGVDVCKHNYYWSALCQ